MTKCRATTPDVEIVVPVYNEEADLEPSVRRLHAYLQRALPLHLPRSRSPTTPAPTRPGAIARRLAATLPGGARRPPRREGPRPGAARPCGAAATRAVLAYMDVDLSTDLAALLPLVAPLLSGHCDVAIGTRLARGVPGRARAPKREFISRCYNLLAARRAAGRGSPTRSAGSRRSAPTCARRAAAARRGHRLVLRHRAARARRAGRAAHPRGAGRLGRRPRLARRHRRRRRSTTCAASGRLLPGARRGRGAGRRAARQLAAARSSRACPECRQPRPAAGALRRDRRREHAGLPAALPGCCAARSAAQARERRWRCC